MLAVNGLELAAQGLDLHILGLAVLAVLAALVQKSGVLVQLLPGAEEATIAALEKTIGELELVTTMLNKGMTPEDILELILGQFGLEILDKMPIQFTCNCTKSRVEKALISIGGRELQEMIDEGKSIEVNCQFCNKHYEFSVDELKKLYEKAKK